MCHGKVVNGARARFSTLLIVRPSDKPPPEIEDMAAIKAAKREMRSRIRAARRALRPGEAQLRSASACNAVIESDEFKRAKTVASYRAMPGEVMTDDIFKAASARGMTMLYPKVEKGERDLKFCAVRRLEDMVPGLWGILEPAAGAEFRPISDADLVIVPGVAFDRRGGRLGQGGGYYDRVFKMMRPDAVRMGIAFLLQIVDEAPIERHDGLVDCLATESGLMRFRSSGGER